MKTTLGGVSEYIYVYNTSSSAGDSKQIGPLLAPVEFLLPPRLEERFKAFP